MKKIAIIGKLCTDKGIVDGQAIKTTILADEIEKSPQASSIRRVNTFGWKKHPLKLFLQTIVLTYSCDDIILMTDAGGIKVFPWLLVLFRLKRTCRLHYSVVGGWLVHLLKKHPFLVFCLKRFEAIYVETHAMQAGLESMGFRNVHIVRNCKPLRPVSEEELVLSGTEPFALCIFSRIMKEKGIEEAVNAVASVNTYCGRTVFHLDIYGQVDDHQTAWFEALSATFPPEIRYCGVAPYDQSVEILKSYFALLFPTKFYTEGIPGTIIDAYAAGVPVVASEWENFRDIVEPGITGIGYPFSQPHQLQSILMDLAQDPSLIFTMKKNCLAKAREYLPDHALKPLRRILFSKSES